MRLALLACIHALLVGAGCASTQERDAPVDGRAPLPNMVDGAELRDIARLPPDDAGFDELPAAPPQRAFAELEACKARVELKRALPVVFEGDLVASLSDVVVDVHGPPGLIVSFRASYASDDTRAYEDVKLPPRVALRLPPGPAKDAPAGASGALFDIGAVMLTTLANVIALPVTLPLGLLTGNPEAFIMQPPSFTQGMFADTVLDEHAWQQEVERRAAPHKDALAREAERQSRFASWRTSRNLDRQARSCTVDAAGRCSLALLWPSTTMRTTFSGLPCAIPPPPPPPAPPAADATTTTTTTTTTATAPVKPPEPLPQETTVTAWLPSLPPMPRPLLLEIPPRDPSDVRGRGARATIEAWRRSGEARVYDADGGAWARAKPTTKASAKAKAKVAPPLAEEAGDVDDVTMVCRIDARRVGWDIDSSPPELRVRVAFGFVDDVAGVTFDEGQTYRAEVGLQHVSLVRGEFVKISVVDVDAFVDDWGGMALARYDGRWPIKLKNARFTAECRALPSSNAR